MFVVEYMILRLKNIFLISSTFQKMYYIIMLKFVLKVCKKYVILKKSRNYNNSFLFKGCSKALLIVVFKMLLNISYSFDWFQNFKICIPIYLK